MQPEHGSEGQPAEFRPRGPYSTRLDTFVDAAFAFSLTLLVISYNQLPDTVAELREALRRVPTFVACFALVAFFWTAHHRWSRRFGLQDARSLLLSLALVLVVLVYVYPLRMVISSFLWRMTGGWLPTELGLAPGNEVGEAQVAFMIYSVGFGLMSGILWALNAHALRCADALALTAAERYDTRSETGSFALLAATAGASFATSLALMPLGLEFRGGQALLAALPMWLYAGLGVAMPIYWARRQRRRGAALAAAATP